MNADILDLKLGGTWLKRIEIVRTRDDGTELIIEAFAKALSNDSLDKARAQGKHHVLALALRTEDDQPWATAEEIAANLTDREIDQLMIEFSKHQTKVAPLWRMMRAKDVEKIFADIEKDDESSLEMFRVSEAEKLFAYYGKPVVELTDGQVLYVLGILRKKSKDAEDERVRRGG